MFLLVEFKNTVRIDPRDFNLTINDAVEEELNRKLANKVMPQTGLCIALYDILKLGDSYILPGDGSSYTNVHFRYVVFRPFIGEIIVGEIKRNTAEGVYVSLYFFDDIFIPKQELKHPSRFDEHQQCWYWEFVGDSEDVTELWMENGQKIRFEVTMEEFVDTRPVGPDRTDDEIDETEEKKNPYKIIGSVREVGFGILSWWNSN